MAAGATYEVIQSQTLASTSASVTFSSISGYTDLVLVCNGGTSGAGNYQLRFNGDTGASYCTTTLFTTGSGVSSGNYPSTNVIYGGVSASLPTDLSANCTFNIFSYANTTAYKMVTTRYNRLGGATKEIDFNVGSWRSTAAITSLNISTYATAYLVDSTFVLYGIKAA